MVAVCSIAYSIETISEVNMGGKEVVQWCDKCGKQTSDITKYLQQTDSEHRSTDYSSTNSVELCSPCLASARQAFKELKQYLSSPLSGI